MKLLYIAKILPILLAVFSAMATGKDYIYLGAWSHHFNDHPKNGWEEVAPRADHPCWKQNLCITGTQYVEYQFNESHDLIGYQTHGYMFGHYQNSFNQSTVVVARSFESQYKDFAFIFAVGATHGYTDCKQEDGPGNATLCPHYQAGIAYTKYRIEPVLSFTGSVLNLTFRVKI